MSLSLSLILRRRFSVCCFFFVSGVGRFLNLIDFALGRMPEPCTRLVKRRTRATLFSLLFFSTFTFTAIISGHISMPKSFLQVFFKKRSVAKFESAKPFSLLSSPPILFFSNSTEGPLRVWSLVSGPWYYVS